MRLAQIVVLALTAALGASSARANRDWLPCNLLTPSGSGLFTFPAGGNGWTQTDPDESGDPRWQFEFRYAVADFDQFEGTDIDRIRVRASGLGISAAVGEKWSVGVFVPHFDVDSATFAASGIGDTTIQGTCLFNADKDSQWWELHLGASLPTGDEEERLGYGDATARVGFAWRLGDKASGDSIRPNWQLSAGANYGHHLGNSDLSTLNTFAGVRGAVGGDGTAFLYSVGASTEWELSEAAEPWPGAVRDDRHQTDLNVGLGLITPEDCFQIIFGARIALDDDGLRDELIPSVHGVFRFGRN